VEYSARLGMIVPFGKISHCLSSQTSSPRTNFRASVPAICHWRAFREESTDHHDRGERRPAGPTRSFAGKPSLAPFNNCRTLLMRPSQASALPLFRCCRLRTLAAVLLLAGNSALAADSPIKSIEVVFEGDAYITNAVFQTSAPPNIAWDVLTDFDNLQKWVPNVTESKAVKRDENQVIVEQKGVARYGALRFPYTSQRKIELKQPTNIKTMQIKGSMKRVESTLLIEPEGKGTRIVYHLEIVPSFVAAGGMSKEFVEHEVREQFTAIVGEMARRVQ